VSGDFRFAVRPAAPQGRPLERPIPFTKMEGLGNDYIYVEEFERPLEDKAALAVRMSDRHFGVGGDGLVIIGPPAPERAEEADFRMRMFNADGSEGYMCGNAARCVGKYVYEKGLTGKTEIRLQTRAGVRLLQLFPGGGKVEEVRVNMGRPGLRPEDIPVRTEGEDFIAREILVQGEVYRGTAVSMGNPHLVLPWPDLADLPIDSLGPAFEHHPLFPRRVNTEFIQVLNRERVRMRVWERGSGETLACGTGACAVLVACVLNRWTGRRAEIELRGGELAVDWAEDGCVYMRGPARTVFSGEFTGQ